MVSVKIKLQKMISFYMSSQQYTMNGLCYKEFLYSEKCGARFFVK